MSDARLRAVATIAEHGLIAIVRDRYPAGALARAEGLLAKGAAVLEVSLTTPGGLEVVESLRSSHPDCLLGAGTVLDATAAASAISAGAQFLVSPAISEEMVAIAHRGGVPMIPGVLTPTEISVALAAGADLIKLFPASFLGPGYLAAIAPVFPEARFVPTGGVDATNAAEWVAAGAAALGVGGALAEGDQLEEIRAALAGRRRGRLHPDPGVEQSRCPSR